MSNKSLNRIKNPYTNITDVIFPSKCNKITLNQPKKLFESLSSNKMMQQRK